MESGELSRCGPIFYEIRVRGELDPRWSVWFDGLTITHEENGDTTLAGPVVDQAALYGLISRVRDLGLTLIAVERDTPGVDADSDHTQI